MNTKEAPALDNARTLAAEYDMLPSGATVVCAVSGGADSMCLLHWLAQRGDLTLHAAHFNHRLRGEESDRDEAFVRDWCDSHGIPFHLGSGDVRAEAKRLKLGLEETARALRYGFLSQLALRLEAERIATAHTANDNAETVLMHLLRGSGLQGLTGIDPRRWKYVRPFLTTSREEVEAYLAFHAVPHVEDSSNADDTYTRNRVRHQLLPLMEELSPGFVGRTTEAIPRLRSDNDCLMAQARRLFHQVEERDGDLALPAGLLAQAPEPVAARLARLLIAQANEGDWDCSAAHIRAVLALARSDDPSGQVHLPRALTVRREYGGLIFTHDAPPEPLTPFAPVQGVNPIPGTAWALVLDAPPWPGLVVRPRQVGDTLTLPGRPSKTVKELFIDEKVPRRRRENIPLLADGDGVLALAGFGPNLAHPRRDTARFINTEKEENDHGHRH